MVKPKVTIGTVQKTAPQWLIEKIVTDRLTIPGGIFIDEADFTADAKGKKLVPSGTLLGRTNAEKMAGTGYGKAAAGDEDITINLHDFMDVATDPYGAGIVPKAGISVAYNFLYDWDNLTAEVQALAFDNFHCLRGRL